MRKKLAVSVSAYAKYIFGVSVNIGKKNAGEYLTIHQFCRLFLCQNFPTYSSYSLQIWYLIYVIRWSIGKNITIQHKILVGENFGKPNTICQYFTPPNSRFTKVAMLANVSYCKFTNIFPCQNSEMNESPKFYPAKILCYMVIGEIHRETLWQS